VRHPLAFDWPVAARLKPTMWLASWPINPGHEFGMCSQSSRIERGLQLHTLADCPSSQALSIHDRCKAVNEAENPELLYAASASSCCPVRSIARR
jgi:hypothetical protein